MANGTSKKKRQNDVPRRQESASFKLYQRKEFVRDLEVPGMMHHILYSFKLIFESWKIFLPLLIIMAVLMIFLAGISTEYLNGQVVVFGSLVFLMIFLVSVFVIRHKLAGNKITLSDALFNSMSPLLATLVILAVAAIQCIPIMVLIVATSAAVETHFLSTPFYAFLFLIFAGLMLLLSFYLLSSTIIAMIATTAPGMYPFQALKISSEVMKGRRIKFVLRIIALLITLVVVSLIVMAPLVGFDMMIKQNFEWAKSIQFVPVCIIILSCALSVYISVYLYIYYRWMIDADL